MRKLLLLFVAVLLVGVGGPAQAAGKAAPLYSVAFPVRSSTALTRDRPGEGVRVATLQGNNPLSIVWRGGWG